MHKLLIDCINCIINFGHLILNKGGYINMENVRTIANWFLNKEAMTHKKLQKLCYYSQAWYCALYDGSPLFNDEIQAWVHGPVVVSLYPVYKKYRWLEIPKQEAAPCLCEKTVAVLDAVWETYGSFTGDQLESLTHSEDPWINARGQTEPWKDCIEPISCDAMREYYGKKYDEFNNA